MGGFFIVGEGVGVREDGWLIFGLQLVLGIGVCLESRKVGICPFMHSFWSWILMDFAQLGSFVLLRSEVRIFAFLS